MTYNQTSSWPVRSLLTPDLTRNLDWRNLAKPVHEWLVLDDMEQDGGWTATDVVTLRYTTERAHSGTRSLRFSTELRNEDYLRFARRPNGSFSGEAVLFDGMPFAASMSRQFSPSQDWSRYNRLSLWCYLHPTTNPVSTLSIQFLCDGASAGPTDPVAVHYISDLTPGEWNHLAWEIPEMARDRVSRLVIFQPLFGLPVADADPHLTYDFDELCLELVDAERVDGWEVTPNRIAYSHIGYQPAAAKFAVATEGPTSFSLLDAANGASVTDLPATVVENRRGRYSLLDFSSFKRPGTYRLRHGAAVTEPFQIGADVWNPVIEAVLNAFYGLRCGIDVPGAHDACHLDVYVEHKGERRVVAGGWHDAANLTQAPDRTHLSIYALLELHESLLRQGSPLAARTLEEALWGIDWSLRMRFGPGLHTLYGEPSYYTDSRPGTIDDVVQDGEGKVGRNSFTNTLAALAAARAARVLSIPSASRLAEQLTGDAQFASRLLQAAREDYGDVTKDVALPNDAPPLDINQPSWRDLIGYLTLAALEIYHTTSEASYAADAVRFARWLIGTQERTFVDGIPVTGYFYEDANRTRIVHEYHNSFEDSGLLAFAALCQTFPTHPDWMDWYVGLALYAEYFCAKGTEASAPFEVIPVAVWRRADIDAPPAPNPTGEWIASMGPSPVFPTAPTRELQKAEMLCMFEESAVLGPDHRLRVFPLWYDNVRHGSTNVHLSKTIGLGAAAQVLHRHTLSDLAARQLQWVLGANPFSRSLMYGVGHDYWQNFSVSLPNLVGGLSVGLNSYRDDSPAWGNNAVFPYKELWIFSVGRIAHNLAYLGFPARVTGAAPVGASFKNRRTGETTAVHPGRFELSLPGGDYDVQFSDLSRQLSLADGMHRELDLDPASALVIDLKAEPAHRNRVTIDLTLVGHGAHRLAARLFNARLEGLPSHINLEKQGKRHLELALEIEDPSMPWLLIIVPDEHLDERIEIGGTAQPLREIA